MTYRIREYINQDWDIKYIIQRRYFGFLWIYVTKVKCGRLCHNVLMVFDTLELAKAYIENQVDSKHTNKAGGVVYRYP